jgi:salicylate hydroxylase
MLNLTQDGDIDLVHQYFSNSCPILRSALNLAQTCDRWKLSEMPNLPCWINQRGRIIILGNSAHAMHPNAAQGLSQNIEDIRELDFLTTMQSDRLPMKETTDRWQKICMPRVNRTKAYAKRNTQIFLGKPVSPKTDLDKNNIKSLKEVQPDREAKFHSPVFLN